MNALFNGLTNEEFLRLVHKEEQEFTLPMRVQNCLEELIKYQVSVITMFTALFRWNLESYESIKAQVEAKMTESHDELPEMIQLFYKHI